MGQRQLYWRWSKKNMSTWLKRKKQKRLLDLLWLLQGLNMSPISSNLEKIHWFWPHKKHTPGHPSPTQPFLRQKTRLKRASNWWKYDIGAFDLAFWLICCLLPKSLLLSSGGHWKVRFFIGGVFPLYQKRHQKNIFTHCEPGLKGMPPTAPKVDEFEDDVFLYLAIYIPTQGFCQKTDVSQKSTITNHDLKKNRQNTASCFFFDSLTCGLGVKSLWQGGNFIFRWKGWVDCCGSPISMYVYVFICMYVYTDVFLTYMRK